jgi:DNA polymerase
MSDNKLIRGHKRTVLIGEAPGRDEDKAGIPFVGRAGKLLREVLQTAKIRSHYIANVCRCRPPSNRTPTEEEMQTCGHFLLMELTKLQPDLIICLGATATNFMKRFGDSLWESSYKELRKAVGFLVTNPMDCQEWIVGVTWHPAYVLRQPGKMDDYKQQFEEIKKFYREIKLGNEADWRE